MGQSFALGDPRPAARLTAGTLVQGCVAPEGCPAEALDPARCVPDPLPFTATELEGEVVAISVDDGAVAALALAPGEYWTAFGDGISCDRLVVTFTVPGSEP
jgi:hypothetical protein